MASIDANSSARVQNGFAWNGVIGSANLWVTALNALNLSTTGNVSRAARALGVHRSTLYRRRVH